MGRGKLSMSHHDFRIKTQATTCLPDEVATLSRRELLKAGVSLSAFASIGSIFGLPRSLLARSGYPPARKLIWINMSGGWDILEVTDPKPASTSGIDMIYGWDEAHPLANGDGTRIGRWWPNVAAMGKDVLVGADWPWAQPQHEAG